MPNAFLGHSVDQSVSKELSFTYAVRPESCTGDLEADTCPNLHAVPGTMFVQHCRM